MKLLFLIIPASLIISCSNNNKVADEKSPEAKTQNSSTTTTNTPATTQAGPYDLGTVSFKVNDTLANTKKGGAKDNEPQLGMYTDASKSLIISFMGDVPNRPHRGTLNLSIKNFKFEPSTFSLSKDNYATYSRYETENAGGNTDFEATADTKNAGTEFTVTFTKVEKDASAQFGNPYLASGAFKVKLYNKIYEMTRKAKQEVIISEGSFENVSIVGKPNE